MFNFFKKKRKLFGNNVDKDCQYCKFNQSDEKIICPFFKGDTCKKYSYDPLKREPKKSPKFKNYDESDFSL